MSSPALQGRVDLTPEKAYTLSQGTRAILGKLDTPSTSASIAPRSGMPRPNRLSQDYAQRVEDLLDEYQQAAKGKIIIEKYDPQPDSDAEDSARLDGVEAQTAAAAATAFYLGLAVSQLDAERGHSLPRSRTASGCWNTICPAPSPASSPRTNRSSAS